MWDPAAIFRRPEIDGILDEVVWRGNNNFGGRGITDFIDIMPRNVTNDCRDNFIVK